MGVFKKAAEKLTSEKMSSKSRRRLIVFIAIITLLSMTTSTVAWFTINTFAGVDTLDVHISVAVQLKVAMHDYGTDLSKYGVEYVDRPTDLIDGPQHPWYPLMADAAKAECRFLIDSQQPDGAWPVPWQWYNEYTAEFEVAKVWWQAHITLKHITYLKNFGAI